MGVGGSTLNEVWGEVKRRSLHLMQNPRSEARVWGRREKDKSNQGEVLRFSLTKRSTLLRLGKMD